MPTSVRLDTGRSFTFIGANAGQRKRGSPIAAMPRATLTPAGIRTENMTRQEAAQAIAKVFAYLACGNVEQARAWARKLIAWLEGI